MHHLRYPSGLPSRNNKMFAIPLLTVLVAQGLLGSAYVVLEEENGYYRAWRSNPVEPQPNPWSSFMNYVPFMQNMNPFLQNMNPFSWWQPQQPIMQEDPAISMVMDRQKALFNIMRCIIEEDSKEMCRKLLGNAMHLFPGNVQVTEIVITKPASSKPTILEIKPVQMEMATMEIKPMMVDPKLSISQVKPVEIEMMAMEGKPMMAEPKLSIPQVKPVEIEMMAMEGKPMMAEPKLSIPQVKPVETEMMAMEGKPMMAEPALSKSADVEAPMPIKIEAEAMEVKPVEAEPAKRAEEAEMKPIEAEPAMMETKPMDVNLKSEEVEAAVV